MTDQTNTILQLVKNTYYDSDGPFDSRKDRERYIKYLENALKVISAECDTMQQAALALSDYVDRIDTRSDEDKAKYHAYYAKWWASGMSMEEFAEVTPFDTNSKYLDRPC